MPAAALTEITKRYEFEAAHWLPYHKGKCKKLHGHTWVLEITVRGPERSTRRSDPQTGMVMDFYLLKDIIKEIDPDHQCLNAQCESESRWKWGIDYPTCERLARRFFSLIEERLPTNPLEKVTLVKITLWETKTGGATVWNASEPHNLPGWPD